jgi:membrane-associated phospholipid phosphatase
MHSAGMSAFAMFASRIYGEPALPLVLAIPLMAWARVHLRRHTVAQTIAGAALGSAIIWLALSGLT